MLDYAKMYLGDTALSRLYQGDDLIWQAAASEWGENIFNTLTFSGGWLDTDGVVQHQTIENYGTSNYFEFGNSSRVRVTFTPRYGQDRIVAVCAYDENYTFVGSAIYDIMKEPFPLVETEFIGEIPNGAKYLRYAYLWGRTQYIVPGDVNTTLQLSRR